MAHQLLQQATYHFSMIKYEITPFMEVLICKCGELFESTDRNGLSCSPCGLRLIKADLDKIDAEMIERVKKHKERDV